MASVPERRSLQRSTRLLSPGTLFLLLILISARVFAGGATLAWDPVNHPSLVGYMVYYGPAAGNYTSSIDVGNTTSYAGFNLVEGATYHFAATAYDAAHTRSGFSNDVSATIPYSAPVAQFSASTTSGTAPLALNFTSASTGTITTYAWTFGDRTTSSAQNPSHVYSSAGAYTVSLTVTGPAGSNTKTASNYITVTRAVVSACPCTIWKPQSAPALAADPDSNAVELGVKFMSDKNGHITGLRYYKANSNTGTHIGSLWTSDGRLLARATFTNETASGWQQVNFATPVAITANTVYVASYHTNVGHYANDDNYFAAAGVDNGLLHALRDGVSGRNGVYSYGANPTFPRLSYRTTNYWVDVIFSDLL